MDPSNPSVTPSLDPTQQPVNGTLPMQNIGGAPTVQQPVQQPAQQPQSVNPQLATAAHDSMIGRAFKILSGNNTQYQVNPQTGQTEQTQVPNTPGQFFKNIVASAIVGAAAGAQNANTRSAGSGVASAAMGANAAMEHDKQLDNERIGRAQQEYANELTAQRNQREQDESQRQAQSFQSSETLRKAQIAQANAETYRLNVLTQGADYTQHQEIADKGSQHFADYKDAGLKPVAENVSESDMQDFLKNRPGASTLDWEPTGVKVGVDAQGNPTHQYTYSAFDPKGKIPVSKGTIDQWKQDGMDKYYPDLFNNVKAGRELDSSQYIALKKLDTSLYNNNLIRQKSGLETQELQAKINESRAQAAHATAETSRVNQEIKETNLNKKEADQFNGAMKHLDEVGGDISKLAPSERLRISESTSKLLPAYNTAIKNAVDAGDTDTAKELMGQMSNITRAASGIFAPPAGPAKFPDVVNILNKVPGFDQKVAAQIANLSPEQIETQLKTAPIPDDVKNQILKAIGKTPAASNAPTAPAFAPQNYQPVAPIL